MADYNFGTLYDYVTKNGVVLPITSAIKTKVENAFKSIFGSDLDVSPETPAGRFIEVITLLFVDVCGANAQNASCINPNYAVGAYLDNIGALFGVARLANENDAQYRTRLLKSQSRGKGYVQSIWNELSKISTLTSLCVLENGEADPAVLPSAIYGCAVDPHSILVCLSGAGTNEENTQIAQAIYATKSAGCAYTDSTEYGTKVETTISDSDTGTVTTVRFYRSIRKYAHIAVSVRGDNYSGDDIIADTKAAVVAYLSKNNTNTNVIPNDILAAISLSGLGIACTSASIQVSSDGQAYSDVSSLLLRPYEYVTVAASDVEVTLV